MFNHAHLIVGSLFAAALVACVFALFVHALSGDRRSAATKWVDIVAKLNTVDRDAVQAIALDLLQQRDEIEPQQLYEMLGGLPGIERLENNCGVLVELATYVERWHPDARRAAEELRLSAREIQWHVQRLKGASERGRLKAVFPDNAQQAVRVYFGMTERVLRLYRDIAYVRLDVLERSL